MCGISIRTETFKGMLPYIFIRYTFLIIHHMSEMLQCYLKSFRIGSLFFFYKGQLELTSYIICEVAQGLQASCVALSS